MNAYDFDKTVYDGDSTIDFYLFCLKNNIKIVKYLPKQLFGFLLFKIKVIDKTRLKEMFFSFLNGIDNIENLVSMFWDSHNNRIKKWFLDKRKANDLIISASPEFLLKPICNNFGMLLIASDINIKTGKFNGKNCYGEEKRKRIEEQFGIGFTFEEFYSDSYSDKPVAEISKKSFIVKNSKITIWKK